MRPTGPLQLAVAGTLFVAAAIGDAGLPPRAGSSDYEAHQTVRDGAVAAALLPPERVARIFSGAVSKGYVVVEIGVYPDNGNGMDLTLIDFALKTPDDRSYPATPAEVAWHGKKRQDPSVSSQSPHVAAELGVAYGTRTNPATGRTDKGLAAWGGAEVDNAPRPNPPMGSADDTYALENRLRALELPEGRTTRPVAGYLFFPAARRKAKNAALDLEYSHNGERVELRFPIR